MNLEEFRFYYPEYDQMGDGELSDALYNKFYPDMDRQKFNQAIEFTPEPIPTPDAVPTPDVITDLPQPSMADRAGSLKDALQGQLDTIGQPGATEDVLEYEAPPDFVPDPESAQTQIGSLDYPFEGVQEVPPPPEVAKWTTLTGLIDKIKSGTESIVKSYEAAQRLAGVSPEAAQALDWIQTNYDEDIRAGMLRPSVAEPKIEAAVEPIASFVSSIAGAGTAGLAGIVEGTNTLAEQVVTGKDVDIGKAMEAAAEIINKVGPAMTYEPRTEAGQQVNDLIGVPFEKLHELASEAAEWTAKRYGSIAGTAVGTLIETAPMWVPMMAKSPIMAKRSTFSVAERGLITQGVGKSMNEWIKANPEASPGQVARRFKSEFARMQKERMEPESAITRDVARETGFPRDIPAEDMLKREAAPVPAAPLEPVVGERVQPANVPEALPPELPAFPGAAATRDIPSIPKPDFEMVTPEDRPPNRMHVAKMERVARRLSDDTGQAVRYDGSVDNGDFPAFHSFTFHKRKGREGSFSALGDEGYEKTLASANDVLEKQRAAKKPLAIEGPEPVEPEPPKPPPKRKGPKVKNLEERKNLGAAMTAIGPIDPLNMRGELKSVGEKGKINPWKMKFKKGGVPYDIAEQMLKDAGFLKPDESIFDLVLDDNNLKRGRLSGDFEAKPEADMTDQERDFKDQMEHEVEAPPPGPYREMKAEDLPEGAELVIIDGKSVEGWDHYKVIAKDPFGVTLQDGETIELTPDEIVQVRKVDLDKAPAAEPDAPKGIAYFKGDKAEYTGKIEYLHGGTFYEVKLLEGFKKGELKLIANGPEYFKAGEPAKEKLVLKGEQDRPEAEKQLKKKAQKVQRGTLTTAFETAKDKAHGPDLRMEGEKAGRKEAEAFKKKTGVDKPKTGDKVVSYEIQDAKSKYTQLQLNFSPPKKPQVVTVKAVQDTQKIRMVTTGRLKSGTVRIKSPAEAASLLAHLRKAPQEFFYTVTTDKAGNVLEVHKYSKGLKDSSQVSISETVGRIFNIKDASHVFIVHNHPSAGTRPEPSDADNAIHRVINNLLDIKDITSNNIIISGTRYGEFIPGDVGQEGTVASAKILPALRNKSIPEKERSLRRTSKHYGQARNPDEIIAMAKKHFPGQDGWMLVDSHNFVVGMHKYAKGTPQGQALVDLYAHLEHTNVGRVVFVNNGPLSAPRRQFLKNVGDVFGNEIAVLDIIEDGISLYSTGQYKQFTNNVLGGINLISSRRSKPLQSKGDYAKTDKSRYPEKEPPKGAKPKEPEPPPKPWGADKDLPPIIDLPELVQIAKALGGGDYPKVMKILGRSLSVAGDFKPAGKGSVRVRAMFESPEAMAKTLAHEIGHWVDYLPEKDMARGNILGRLAGFKKYMKHSMPFFKGAKAELTPGDRTRLKKEARDILNKENAGELIDEVIEKELPITPDDILNIWRSADPATLASNAELYDYIQRLSGINKKAIVKAAMKGIVPNELKKFAKVVKEATGKKIKFKPTDEQIRKKYQELILKEIEKRRLFERDTVMEELKALTRAYKPFDPLENPTYTKYRYSGVELYADFFSSILNDPFMAQQYAPDAWEAFFNYLDSKPEFRDLYQSILDDIYSGKVNPKLRRTVREGFRKGDDEYFDKLSKSPVTATHLKRDLIDSNAFLLKYIRKARKAGADIAADKNPLFAAEDMMYSMAEVESLIQDFYRSIIRPLRKANIDYDLFGEYIYYRRVVHPKEMGGRAEFANPEGIHPDRAAELMKEIEGQVGKDKLMALVKDFRRIHVENFVERSEQYKIHDKKLLDIMKDAVAYATFDVNGYFDTRYGDAVGNHVKKQIGTFRDIKNPVTATLMKDIAFTKFAYRNRAAKVLIDFLRENFRDQVKATKQKYAYKGHEFKPVSPRNPDWGTVFYWENGKLNAYDVPKELAKSVNGDPIGLQGLVSVLRFVAKPYRKIFTELNPGFMIMNAFRDYMSGATKIPGNSIIGFADSFLKGIKPAFKSVYGIPDPVVEEMRRGNPMLITVADWRGMNPEDKQIERLLAQYHMTPKGWRRNVRDPFWRFFAHISNIGRVVERSTKFGSYLYLKKNFNIPQADIAHKVRHYGGSPSFLTMGRGAPILNNLLLFSNPQIQDYREQFQSFKEDKVSWTWKKIKYTAFPKMIMYLGTLGILGPSLKYLYDQVSEYDMKNYIVVPIGFTKSGKAVYMRIPQDEASRFAGGVLWNVLSEQRQNFLTELADYAGGQVPSLTPGWGTLVDIRQYISGKNPYDYFRGQHAVPDQVFKAGGPRAHKAFLKWLAKNNGAGIVYQFQTDDVDRIKTELEQFLGYPLVSNIIGRFIKVSDSGQRSKYREDRGVVQKKIAQEGLDVTDQVIKLVNGEKLSMEDIAKLVKNVDSVPDKYMKFLFRRHGVIFMQNWTAATSTEEKAAVLERALMLERDRAAAMKEGKMPTIGGGMVK